LSTVRRSRPAKLPSRNECLQLLRENGCSEDVVEHCIAVSKLAGKIARHCGADVELVEIGGLLHDLGRCRAHDIRHAVEGAKVARENELAEPLVKIIERHIGAGIKRSEAKELGLPEKEYIPKTLEEMIVSHSDNLIAGTKRTTVREAAAYLTREGMQEPAIRILNLHRRLSKLCGMDVDEIP
jgi:uncharacterized protein